MTTPPSGWYLDPSGDPSKFRYWDGATWTDHSAPQQAATPVQAASPTGGGEQAGVSPEGTGDAAAAGESGTAAPGAGEQAGAGQPTAARPGQEQPKKGKGIIIGIIAAIIAVILLVTGNGGDDRGGPDTQPPATTQPTDEPTDELIEDPGEIVLDEPITGSLGADGSWTGTLTIDEDTPVLLDAQYTGSGEDLENGGLADDSYLQPHLRMSITGEGVDLKNDDRDYHESRQGQGPYDPAIAVHLAPGTYEVWLSERYGQGGEFELNAFDVPMFDVDATETVDQRRGGPGAYGAVEVTEDGTYVFDTVATEGDAEMTVVFPDGTYEYSDDTDEGAGEFRDPYLSLDLEPGIYFVFVGDRWKSPGAQLLELELSITQE